MNSQKNSFGPSSGSKIEWCIVIQPDHIPDAVPADLPLAPGSHGALAEKYRKAAMEQMMLLQALTAELEDLLRRKPDDDAAFDNCADRFQSAREMAGALVLRFRITRDCEGAA